VKLWQTPVSDDSVEREKGKWNSRGEPKLSAQVKLWPTPRAQEAKHGAATEWELQTDHAGTKDSLRVQVVKRMWPTPSAREPGWKNIEVVDKDGNPPGHHNQRFYDKKTGRVVQKGLQQTVADPKTGGQLNPTWVAWLMGYPLEWLSCVPWETQSSRKSHRR
jgi:hypothetical protein